MSRRVVGASFVLLIAAVCFACLPTITNAISLQSENYRFDESSISSGGLIQSSSANFQASSATGSLAVGNSASENFQVEAGTETTNDPTLSFKLNNGDAKFDNFTASSATVTTAEFSVSNYTSYGYVVQMVGTPPTNGDSVIDAMTTTDASQPGTEQFGVNLVANTLPVSVGANPDNGDFGFGLVAPNYATSNQYRFVSGETIATAPKSSGETIYTISYLVNVDGLTPGGRYTSDQTLVVTGTY